MCDQGQTPRSESAACECRAAQDTTSHMKSPSQCGRCSVGMKHLKRGYVHATPLREGCVCTLQCTQQQGAGPRGGRRIGGNWQVQGRKRGEGDLNAVIGAVCYDDTPTRVHSNALPRIATIHTADIETCVHVRLFACLICTAEGGVPIGLCCFIQNGLNDVHVCVCCGYRPYRLLYFQEKPLIAHAAVALKLHLP